jgi:hypothetical protein
VALEQRRGLARAGPLHWACLSGERRLHRPAIAAGIVGATVMAHNLFLHSAVVRRENGSEAKHSALSLGNDFRT